MEGAKTGLSTVVVAALFALSAFISPLLGAIPHLATAAPLVLIGAFMMGPIGGIDWDKLHVALPSFVTCTVVPFTYSIHTGILAGILMDSLLSLMTWCRNGCRPKKHRVDSGVDTPERQLPSGLNSPSRIVPPSELDQRVRSGTSTPTRLAKNYQSPHTRHVVTPSLIDDQDIKDEKVEKLLNELQIAFSSAGYRGEPRDNMLLQALQDFLLLRPSADEQL
jgi:hypothetical protein